MATIKIKASHPSQGEYILIEEEDFDATKHEVFGAQKPAEKDADPAPVRGIRKGKAE